jgi:NAD(P)-dependent dehydrogenase (short-subunit alcohol dehydrogenase family)
MAYNRACALRAVQRAGISPSVQHECAGHVPHDRSRFSAFGAEGGSIINIGSEASVTAYPTLSIYVASKSAVNGLTRALSKEFGPREIRVNALNPGGTETEGAHAAGVMGTESKKQIIASTPLGRVGQPEDIARVAVFLASVDALVELIREQAPVIVLSTLDTALLGIADAIQLGGIGDRQRR